jgi:hypothetical protein
MYQKFESDGSGNPVHSLSWIAGLAARTPTGFRGNWAHIHKALSANLRLLQICCPSEDAKVTFVQFDQMEPSRGWICHPCFMSSISIPVDILCIILEHLNQDDLTRICLLNKICCSYSQDILYRDIYFPDILVCDTLAQSTHLARRVRSFATRSGHLELAKALRNMTRLRSLTLLSVSDSSNVLDGCIFSLDTFTCRFPYDESLLKFLLSQPSLREAHFLAYSRFIALLDVEPMCLPNLTRITAHYTWLPHIVPGRPVSEVASFGQPHDGSPVDLSFYALSTVPIQKLEISHLLLPNSERLLASIFPSLTHLKAGLYIPLLSTQEVCARFLLFYLMIGY